jgi:hypothetical protein
VLKIGDSHRLKQLTARIPEFIKPLTAPRLLDRLQQLCEAASIAKVVGLHSCRIGGATAAANGHVEDRLFQQHGRWRSTEAMRGYVRPSLVDLLSVSRGLGL